MTDNSEQQTSTTPTKPKKGFFGYAWRTILWFLVILYFALGAAWLGARYCLAPYLNEHKSKIENKISQVRIFLSSSALWTLSGRDCLRKSRLKTLNSASRERIRLRPNPLPPSFRSAL